MNAISAVGVQVLQSQGSLLTAIFDATEVVAPASFVILPGRRFALTSKPGEIPSSFYLCHLFLAKIGVATVSKGKDQVTRLCSWFDHVTDMYEMSEMSQGEAVEATQSLVRKKISGMFYSSTKYYLYLVDDLTGKCDTSEGSLRSQSQSA